MGGKGWLSQVAKFLWKGSSFTAYQDMYTVSHNVWEIMKAVLRGKFSYTCLYFKKLEKSYISNLLGTPTPW